MRAVRTGTLVAWLCTLSVSAAAVEVFDPVNSFNISYRIDGERRSAC